MEYYNLRKISELIGDKEEVAYYFILESNNFHGKPHKFREKYINRLQYESNFTFEQLSFPN